MDYRDFNDNELLDYIYESNEDANEIMFKKYEPLVVNTATKIYNQNKNCGVEVRDLVQEGMLGLNIAINKFVDQRDASFYTFAKLCIERKITSAIIGSNRKKHRILNESLSIDNYDDETNSSLEAVLSIKTDTPEYQIINEEKQNDFINKAKNKLTPFEKQVFELKLKGFDYKEIASILQKDKKAIDNAIQRMKNKLKVE